MILLAVLRPPPPRTPARPALDVAGLGALLLAGDAGRVLRKTAKGLEIAVDTGTGQNLGVTVHADEIRIMAAPHDGSPQIDEEHGELIEDDDSEIEDAAGELVCTLQAATGWHVDSDRLLGFDPSGVCPSCQIECFEWQDRCSACDAELETAESTEGDEDRQATQLLQALLREDLIELATRRGASAVEGVLALHFANGRPTPERLLEVLINMNEVAEVFADEADIARLLGASAPRSRQASSPRLRRGRT